VTLLRSIQERVSREYESMWKHTYAGMKMADIRAVQMGGASSALHRGSRSRGPRYLFIVILYLRAINQNKNL
jgi:hypothetical protein